MSRLPIWWDFWGDFCLLSYLAGRLVGFWLFRSFFYGISVRISDLRWGGSYIILIVCSFNNLSWIFNKRSRLSILSWLRNILSFFTEFWVIVCSVYVYIVVIFLSRSSRGENLRDSDSFSLWMTLSVIKVSFDF